MFTALVSSLILIFLMISERLVILMTLSVGKSLATALVYISIRHLVSHYSKRNGSNHINPEVKRHQIMHCNMLSVKHLKID